MRALTPQDIIDAITAAQPATAALVSQYPIQDIEAMLKRVEDTGSIPCVCEGTNAEIACDGPVKVNFDPYAAQIEDEYDITALCTAHLDFQYDQI